MNRTPLHCAAGNDNVAALEILLNLNGIDVNAKSIVKLMEVLSYFLGK